jgi:hypothetical protein
MQRIESNSFLEQIEQYALDMSKDSTMSSEDVTQGIKLLTLHVRLLTKMVESNDMVFVKLDDGESITVTHDKLVLCALVGAPFFYVFEISADTMDDDTAMKLATSATSLSSQIMGAEMVHMFMEEHNICVVHRSKVEVQE